MFCTKFYVLMYFRNINFENKKSNRIQFFLRFLFTLRSIPKDKNEDSNIK